MSALCVIVCLCFLFFQEEDGIRDGHVTGVQTCALPISLMDDKLQPPAPAAEITPAEPVEEVSEDKAVSMLSDLPDEQRRELERDRKSTRLNSSHVAISYAVFCLKKKNKCTQ